MYAINEYGHTNSADADRRARKQVRPLMIEQFVHFEVIVWRCVIGRMSHDRGRCGSYSMNDSDSVRIKFIINILIFIVGRIEKIESVQLDSTSRVRHD
jgi:hypothetical protein